MTLRLVRSSHIRRAGLVLAVGSAALVAACGGGSTSNSANTNNQAPTASGKSAANQAVLDKVYTGTLASPDPTSRAAVKDKKIVIISAGQSSISSSVPVNAAVDAAKKMGWHVTVYDSQLNPANLPNLMSQAIASGAQGIVADFDCYQAKSQLEQAKAKHIVVVPIYAYDCNDPYAGKPGTPALWTGYPNYGPEANKNLGAFAEQYGFAQGQAAIAAAHGQAKVVFFNDLEATVLYYTGTGFKNAIKACSGCKIVDEIDFKGLDLGPTLQQRAATAILQHPEANVVKSPFTAATLLSIAPAVQQSGHASKLYVMGGEGFQPELDLIRNHAGVNAVMISPSDWTGWAAIDTMNSLFRNEKPAFSGLGWQLVDPSHNMPASGAWKSPVDFASIYKKAWGVS